MLLRNKTCEVRVSENRISLLLMYASICHRDTVYYPSCLAPPPIYSYWEVTFYLWVVLTGHSL